MLNIPFPGTYESNLSFLDRAVPHIIREPGGHVITDFAVVKLTFSLVGTMQSIRAPAFASAQFDTFGKGIYIRCLFWASRIVVFNNGQHCII